MANNIFSKIQKARTMFYAKGVKKSGKNSYSGYDYFELADFVPQCTAICNEVGLCPVVSFEDGYAVMTVYDTESEGQMRITSPLADATLKGCHPIQNLGAVETYSRRYLWMLFMDIVEADPLEAVTGKPDNDKPVSKAKEPARKPENANNAKVVTPQQPVPVASIWGTICKSFGWTKGMPKEDEAKLISDARQFVAGYGVKEPKTDSISEETRDSILKALSERQTA